MKKIVVLITISLLILSFTKITEALFVVPKNWPNPTYNFSSNPLTKEKIQLGKLLFNEPLLSRNNTISCSSCHLSFTGFTHTDHDVSHGIDDRIGTRNSLQLINLAWSKSFMWDGSIYNLNTQAITPITHFNEMDESFENIIQKLKNNTNYTQQFTKAFGTNGITKGNILLSLTQYMLTMQSYNSKYDKVMNGEKGVAFNTYEQKGLEVFNKHCNSCHTAPLFTNNSFENNGLSVDTFFKDRGRIAVTKNDSDDLKFKVPTLRNVEVTYPYMHDGRFKNLQMVLFHYTETVQANKTLSIKNKIVLTEEDKNCLIAFLKTLTDEEFLRNQKFIVLPD